MIKWIGKPRNPLKNHIHFTSRQLRKPETKIKPVKWPLPSWPQAPSHPGICHFKRHLKEIPNQVRGQGGRAVLFTLLIFVICIVSLCPYGTLCTVYLQIMLFPSQLISRTNAKPNTIWKLSFVESCLCDLSYHSDLICSLCQVFNSIRSTVISFMT